MNTLTKTQILYIDNDLKARGLSDSFRNELLDHICCMSEVELKSGKSFSESYRVSLDIFGDKGFSELKTIKSKQRSFIPSKVFTTGIAACILMMVFIVDAQDQPDIHPLRTGCKISSQYGERLNPFTKKIQFHTGIDFPIPAGTPVKSTAGGTVKKVTETDGRGKRIVLQHVDGYQTSYSNLFQINVEEGEKVNKGQVIALSGNSGKSTAPHLHYEVIKNGEQVNPADYLSAK